MTQIRFVNLMRRDVVLYERGEPRATIPSSGQVVRLVDAGDAEQRAPLGGVPVAVHTPLQARRLEGLPDPRSGVAYVCSVLCLAAARAAGRHDVVAPDTDAGAVRVPRGGPDAGQLLGTARLLLCSDDPPEYRAVFGSATVPGADPRDLDVLGWGGARLEAPPASRACWPAGTALDPGSVDALARESYERARRGDLRLDYHEVEPELDEDGCWVVPAPAWGEEDPSRPALLWHSPCARPVRVERRVLRTGPARLRRFAATGIAPDLGAEDLVVEFDAGGDAPGYRGCGLLAWRRAAERLSEGQRAELQAPERELLDALLQPSASDLRTLASRARSVLETLRAGGGPQGLVDAVQEGARFRDAAGSPGGGGRVVLVWDPDRAVWRAPKADGGYPTFDAALRAWCA